MFQANKSGAQKKVDINLLNKNRYMKNEAVSKLMTTNIVVAHQFHNFSQVMRLFTEFPVHHLPVVDGQDRLVGIISSNDMVKAFKRMLIAGETIQSLDQLDQQINLTEIMTPNPVTLAHSDPVGKAIELFAQKKFQALPVVEHGKVVGIVSIKDVVEFFHIRG